MKDEYKSSNDIFLGLTEGIEEFEHGQVAIAIELFRQAVRLARDSNIIRVQDEAKEWGRRQIAREVELALQDRDQMALEDLARNTYKDLDQHGIVDAVRYSLQPERIREIEVEFMSNNGIRKLLWSKNRWSCDCDYFRDHRVCSHLVALSLYGLSNWAPETMHKP